MLELIPLVPTQRECDEIIGWLDHMRDMREHEEESVAELTRLIERLEALRRYQGG